MLGGDSDIGTRPPGPIPTGDSFLHVYSPFMEPSSEGTEPSPDPSSSKTPDLSAVAEALSASVRDALERNEPAEVPGMGVFRVEHRPSQMNEQEEGLLSVSPPRDVIVFEPATS